MLRLELHQYRLIFESVSNGITIADATKPDLPLLYVNPTFERMTGYTADDVCGRSCRFLQGAETHQADLETVRQALRHGKEARVVLRNFRKDGSPFWNELYLSPIHDAEGRLTYFVGIQNDVTIQIDSAQRLHHLAHYDALTGLANRGLLMDRLQDALLRARPNKDPVALLYVDLDFFKQVNDTFGHDAGDTLLLLVADRLRSVIHPGETVARIGGDEFVVLLRDLSPSRQPLHVVAQLLARLSETTDVLGARFHPSGSVGMAVYPDDGDTPGFLLKTADLRMYLAKHNARANRPQEMEPGPSELLQPPFGPRSTSPNLDVSPPAKAPAGQPSSPPRPPGP